MSRQLFALFVAAMLIEGALSAHHSYAAYDREHLVSVEGDIEKVIYANPHVVVTLRTNDAQYTVEWGNLFQLAYWHITKGELKPGDHVVITGRAFRDPNVHTLSLLTDIRRPADDWHSSRTPSQ